ncbi:MAG: hypothetical protein ACRERR_05150 [Moraxellaceae bacterium]
MKFRTFLKTGIEVLHLGGHRWESNSWSAKHWKENSGRWRLFTPAIDDFLGKDLSEKSFGGSIDGFVLLLEVADFDAWGSGIAFTGPEGFSRYKHKSRELWSVGRIDWKEVQHLPTSQQLKAYAQALHFAITTASQAKQKPKDFSFQEFSDFIANRLQTAKVSQLSKTAYAKNGNA